VDLCVLGFRGRRGQGLSGFGKVGMRVVLS